MFHSFNYVIFIYCCPQSPWTTYNYQHRTCDTMIVETLGMNDVEQDKVTLFLGSVTSSTITGTDD